MAVDPWVQTNPMCPETLKESSRLDTMLIPGLEIHELKPGDSIG
jgi:hypothetical protein